MPVIVHSKNQTYLKQYGKVCNKNDLLMVSLTKYFSDPVNFDILLPIVNGNSDISLRIIDWFVTNYSKKNNTSYTIKDTSRGIFQQFIVYLNYKLQLKAYSKKQFDPFCRRERIAFYYINKNGENKCIHTTVGQLNFFRWAIGYKIIDYIQKNIKTIENDMNTIQKSVYSTEKKSGSRRKRKELSKSATKTINKHNVKIVLEFT
tara:strand:+ start:135 stop:746 length:612 start_codon:yes stop_codon:yes gene_type:complete